MHRFAQAYHITYPMLSDQGSIVIRRFGILNTNVPPDVKRFYGIPFPGQYLVAADATVKDKIFLPDYQTRPTASEVLLRDFAIAAGNAAVVTDGIVGAKIVLSDARTFSGQQLGVAVDFEVASGWHVYGTPLPEAYSPTAVTFDDDLVASQTLNFPHAAPIRFEALDETLSTYSGSFKVSGNILLKQRLKPGDHKIAGTVEFQECSDSLCKTPQALRFEIPIRIDPMVPAAPSE